MKIKILPYELSYDACNALITQLLQMTAKTDWERTKELLVAYKIPFEETPTPKL